MVLMYRAITYIYERDVIGLGLGKFQILSGAKKYEDCNFLMMCDFYV